MIGRRDIPAAYADWNRKWGAPNGRPWPIAYRWRETWPALRFRGRFAHQRNAETREFEYPWAYHAVRARGRNLNVVEIGGGLSGLQWVLAAEGHHVTNIDPGARTDGDWGFDPAMHARLGRIFRAPVTLLPTTVADAKLEAESADVVLSVSVLEHLAPDELERSAKAITRLIKPDGVLILSADLFLDLIPFTSNETGRWGRNVNLQEFLRSAHLELIEGTRAELFGFADFNAAAVKRDEATYLVGVAKSTAQCLVAGRTGRSTQSG